MRMLRSLFFGGLAALVAVMFMSEPSRALDYQPSAMSAAYDGHADCVLAVAEVARLTIVQVEPLPAPSVNAHAVRYTIQNQPRSPWRFAAKAYARIDPHIPIG